MFLSEENLQAQILLSELLGKNFCMMEYVEHPAAVFGRTLRMYGRNERTGRISCLEKLILPHYAEFMDTHPQAVNYLVVWPGLPAEYSELYGLDAEAEQIVRQFLGREMVGFHEWCPVFHGLDKYKPDPLLRTFQIESPQGRHLQLDCEENWENLSYWRHQHLPGLEQRLRQVVGKRLSAFQLLAPSRRYSSEQLLLSFGEMPDLLGLCVFFQAQQNAAPKLCWGFFLAEGAGRYFDPKALELEGFTDVYALYGEHLAHYHQALLQDILEQDNSLQLSFEGLPPLTISGLQSGEEINLLLS